MICLLKFSCYLYLDPIVCLDVVNQMFKYTGNYFLLGALITDILALKNSSRDNSEAEEPEGTYETTEKTLLTSVNLAAIVTTIGPEHKLEIYDSGATQHMIPSCHRLINFQPIQPQEILAADKKHFEAIGKEDMFVQVPNGDKSKKVYVKNMLYAPNLGVTLLSVIHII